MYTYIGSTRSWTQDFATCEASTLPPDLALLAWLF